jgi:valyl-tRNA synthetase
VHGADALRFGLLAMSSTQDVRYSAAKVQQGQDLANKMWNASRLILLNAAEPGTTISPSLVEDRWIVSRLERLVASVLERFDQFDFAHVAQELYRFFWSELCDWYLEIAKPRLYEAEPEVSAILLAVLERFLALTHPVMPFVTEEIFSHLPGRQGLLVVHPYPELREELVDAEAEADMDAAIQMTRTLRRWRDLMGIEAAAVLAARAPGEAPHELVGRLARVSFDSGGGEAIASVGGVEILATGDVDAGRVAERIAERRRLLEAEVDRAQRKLANEGFVAKAPSELIESERRKLDAYRLELEELLG